MDHDVGYGELAEVEHAAEHVAVELHHAAFLVMQLDGAAKLLMGAEHLDVVTDIGAEQPQGVPHQELHGGGYWREHGDQGRTTGATARAMRSELTMA